MTQSRVYLSPPHMGPDEFGLLEDAFNSNWIAPLGPHVDAFEAEVAARTGVSQALALSSGTGALHLAVILAGVTAGDEVLCSTLTFAASTNVISYVGARPVFVDSDISSWNLDPELVEVAIRERIQASKTPKALIAVDLYGQCADYDRLEQICSKYGVTIIEDAAEAIGATRRKRQAGSFGRMAVFSFNGNKIITTSGGGMLVSDDEELIEKARFLATQARDPEPHYQHSEIGYNYRMSNLLAAVGRGQLRVLEDRVSTRRRNFSLYREGLGDLPGIIFMPEPAECRSTRWLTCLTIDPDVFGATREDVRLALENENIEARPVWKPMHLQPVFSDCLSFGGEVSEQLFRDGLCLPSGSCLTDRDRGRVIEIVRGVCNVI